MKEPARLYKVENPEPVMDFRNMMLLHPTAIIIGIGISLFLTLALIFAITGHSATDSGGLRNFIARGC